MAKKLKPRRLKTLLRGSAITDSMCWKLRATNNRVFLRKYHCSAAIERTPEGGVKIFAYPGYLINGEISKLIDHGYQKVLKTTKADTLRQPTT